MATTSFSSTISHTNTTNFRLWGAELSAAFTTVGFLKSDDTGQVDWTTVNRPAINTTVYEIRYLNDSLHGTAPVYVKIEYGTGDSANLPVLWVTTGTGTDGTGTITGVITAREQIPNTMCPLTSTSINYPRWVCMTEGAVWFLHKAGASRDFGGGTCFFIFRSCDAFGAPSADSVVVYMSPTFNGSFNWSARTYAKTFATGYVAQSLQAGTFGGGSYTFMPYGLSSTTTTVSGIPPTFQAARHFLITPQIFPLMNVLSLSPSDAIGLGTVIQATPVGSTQHNYINLTTYISAYEDFCPIWE